MQQDWITGHGGGQYSSAGIIVDCIIVFRFHRNNTFFCMYRDPRLRLNVTNIIISYQLNSHIYYQQIRVQS